MRVQALASSWIYRLLAGDRHLRRDRGLDRRMIMRLLRLFHQNRGQVYNLRPDSLGQHLPNQGLVLWG